MSGVVRMAQAAPSDTPQQSYRPSGSAIIGEWMTSSMVIGLRRWALGLRPALAWLFTDTWAIARLRSFASMQCLAR